MAEKYKSFDTGNADKVYDDKEEGQANNEDQRGDEVQGKAGEKDREPKNEKPQGKNNLISCWEK